MLQVEQFHKGKTRTATTEETGRLNQSDGREEGPLIGGQGVGELVSLIPSITPRSKASS
jgi:hypothetical protein